MLTETTKDPEGKADNYAYRALEYNEVNGDEMRILDGKKLESEYSKFSLVDSSAEKDAQFGEAFHIYIPAEMQFGYPWSRNGTVKIGRGTFMNIRAFSKKYADYTGEFYDNPYMFDLGKKIEKKEVKEEEAPQKKRRGRPPKNAQKAVETKVETKVEKVETQVKTNEQVAKKRRGRPRKIVQNVDETPVQKKENIEVKPVVKAKEESISKVEKVETVEQANPVAALVKAINRLTREVNSLKRLVAGKKRINY